MNHVLDGGAGPQEEGAIFGGRPDHSKALAISSRKGIIQSPITSCSWRDHSVCQASANSIMKMSGRRRCGLSAAKGAVGLNRVGEVWYLRLPRCELWHRSVCWRVVRKSSRRALAWRDRPTPTFSSFRNSGQTTWPNTATCQKPSLPVNGNPSYKLVIKEMFSSWLYLMSLLRLAIFTRKLLFTS